MKKNILFILVILFAVKTNAQFRISGLGEQVQKARPGDTIRIPNGNYKDAQLVLAGKGEAGKPIVVIAEAPGRVILSGNSYLKLGGSFVEINGLHFTNGYAA